MNQNGNDYIENKAKNHKKKIKTLTEFLYLVDFLESCNLFLFFIFRSIFVPENLF